MLRSMYIHHLKKALRWSLKLVLGSEILDSKRETFLPIIFFKNRIRSQYFVSFIKICYYNYMHLCR